MLGVMVAEAPDQTWNLGKCMTNSKVANCPRSIALEAARRLEAMIAVTEHDTFFHQAMCSANAVILQSGLLASQHSEKFVDTCCSGQTRDTPIKH